MEQMMETSRVYFKDFRRKADRYLQQWGIPLQKDILLRLRTRRTWRFFLMLQNTRCPCHRHFLYSQLISFLIQGQSYRSSAFYSLKPYIIQIIYICPYSNLLPIRVVRASKHKTNLSCKTIICFLHSYSLNSKIITIAEA